MSAGRLGLDELMIVNPDAGGLRAMFLGGDGALYAVEEIGADSALSGDTPLPGRFFLGDDGTLYQVTSAPRR